MNGTLAAAAGQLRHLTRWTGLPLMLAAVVLLFLLHVSVGARSIPLAETWAALFHYDAGHFDHVIIRDLRLPRAAMAAAMGCALAVAGALMQGITRNPLAEPGILGVETGAAFAVVMAIGVLGLASVHWLPIYAAAGALATTLTVYSIARWAPGGATPLTLVLAGVAVTWFLSALNIIALLLHADSFENLRVWLAGSLAGRDVQVLYAVAPWLLLALLLAMGLARRVTALSMGDSVAVGLGVNTARLKLQALLCAVVLSACSVALAGPVGFVGLVVPHAVRLFVGSDYRWIIPYCAVAGAGFLLLADMVARMVLRPQEVAIGIVTALVGAPLFVHLVRQRAR